MKFERTPRRDPVQMLPRAVEGEEGLFVVDATWGRIAPIELESGVRTVGELEVIEHARAGLALIDTRREHFYREATIPGARLIVHDEILEHRALLDPSLPSVLFCNGPQCAATPDAISLLLQAGYPADAILYYRGGIHDWITLGLPVEPGEDGER